jgi:uncharacterized coiled-coil protein SlyX
MLYQMKRERPGAATANERTLPIMTDERTILERMTAIESLLTHLQYDVDQLNAVVLGSRREIDSLRRDLDGLKGQLERLETPAEIRDPRLEKPPHY